MNKPVLLYIWNGIIFLNKSSNTKGADTMNIRELYEMLTEENREYILSLASAFLEVQESPPESSPDAQG